MDKQGMLLVEETLKMILAVIGIGFLVVFLVQLYFAKVQGSDLNKANADLDYLKTVINGKGENVTLNNPVGWNVFSFVGETRPNACAGETCLCVCDKVLIDSFILFDTNRQFDECNKNGACVAVKNLKSFEPIEITKFTQISFNYDGGVSLK